MVLSSVPKPGPCAWRRMREEVQVWSGAVVRGEQMAAGGRWCLLLIRCSGKLGAESETPAPCVEGDFGTCDLDVTVPEAGNRGTTSRISYLTSPGPPGDHMSQSRSTPGPASGTGRLTYLSLPRASLPFSSHPKGASPAASDPTLPFPLSATTDASLCACVSVSAPSQPLTL